MKKRTNTQRIVGAVAGLALIASACGSDTAPVADGPRTPPEAPATTVGGATASTVPATGGWIDGEPTWSGALSDGSDGLALESRAVEGDIAATSGVAPESKELAAPTADFAVEAASDAPIPVEPDGGIGDGAEPLPIELPPSDREPPIDPVQDTTPLRAGSVDDNADYQGFLDYLARIDGLGIVTRPLDSSQRSVVTVRDAAGNPSAGVVVTATAGDATVNLRTTADGTVRFHPNFYDMGTAQTITFTAGEQSVDAAIGTDATIEAGPQGTAATAPVPLDVLFLLDATGSMGDEIDRLKQTIDTVADRAAALDPAPDVRFAMTLYRDEGDAFVTANYDFTSDIAQFKLALDDVVADGGGDYPEALDEGLADALAKPTWRDPSAAVQLIFVVADAPPQVGRQLDTPYTDSIRDAVGRGIKVFPVASSESDDQAEAVFRQMAQATGAPFVFLSNGAAGASTGASTDIASTDYEELALDELVVRLIAEELADLSAGGEVTVPTTVAPETTNPEGQ